jgi:hypothetical protein
MKHLGPTLLVLSATSLLGGCAEYFSVDEACPEKISGVKDLSPSEADAALRITCHRRLAGVVRAVPNDLVQQAARNALNYVLLNPTGEYLDGEARENAYLRQLSQNPGFTGSGVYDRLTDETLGVGYLFYDEVGSNVREYIDIQWSYDEALPLPSGGAAIDYLMKDPQFRQNVLQPSMIDIAFAEIDLPPEWFAQAGFEEADLPVSGRAYYQVSIYTEPHLEHADSPVVYPKEGQTDVPLWAFTHAEVIDDQPGKIYSQTGYPITFLMGAIDPINYYEIEFNQYRGEINYASLLDPSGQPVEVRVLMPGDERNGTLPDGTWMRTTLTVYPLEPLQPSTKYTFSAEVSSPESNWSYNFDFTTVAAERDPGANADLSGAGTTTATTATTGL